MSIYVLFLFVNNTEIASSCNPMVNTKNRITVAHISIMVSVPVAICTKHVISFRVYHYLLQYLYVIYTCITYGNTHLCKSDQLTKPVSWHFAIKWCKYEYNYVLCFGIAVCQMCFNRMIQRSRLSPCYLKDKNSSSLHSWWISFGILFILIW